MRRRATERVEPGRRRRRLPPPDDRRPGDTPRPRSGIDARRGRPRRRAARRRLLRGGRSSTRAARVRIRDFAALTEEAHAQGRPGHRGRRPPGADPADAAGGVGSRRGRRVLPAIRRAALVRRSARRLHGGAGGPRARPARAPRRDSRSTPRSGRPTGWRCRRASSTSAGRRPPRTSAPPRCCWPSWPPCTPCTTAPRACAASPAACTAAPWSWRRVWRRPASRLAHREFFDTLVVETAGPGRGDRRGRAQRGASSCDWSTRTTSGSRAARRPPRPTSPRCSSAFGAAAARGRRAGPGPPCPRRCCAGGRS